MPVPHLVITYFYTLYCAMCVIYVPIVLVSLCIVCASIMQGCEQSCDYYYYYY